MKGVFIPTTVNSSLLSEIDIPLLLLVSFVPVNPLPIQHDSRVSTETTFTMVIPLYYYIYGPLRKTRSSGPRDLDYC